MKLNKILLKRALGVLVFVIMHQNLYGQKLYQVDTIQIDESSFDNVYVQALANDSLSSSFIIWIKESVPLHKHEHHTEYVYVLEGNGLMQLGNELVHMKAGDLIHIPCNTPHEVREVNSKHPLKVISVQMPFFDGKDRHALGEEFKVY